MRRSRATLGNARKLRDVTGVGTEHKLTIAVNLLGIFNYESVEDFLKSSEIIHDLQSNSVTITDKETATRIATASIPYLANSDSLRKVLYEATIATAAYSTVNGKNAADFKIQQSMLTYDHDMSSSELRKELRLALLIGQMTPAELNSLPMQRPRHVLIDARQTLGNDQFLKMFFEDPATRLPHTFEALEALGRGQLAALLDPNDQEDAKRLRVLNNEKGEWDAMNASGGQAPADSPASYSDWIDIRWWAASVHNTAHPLKAALAALASVPAGADVSQDKKFMDARRELRDALGKVTHDAHAAFEKGWPIAVTFALVGGNTDANVKATWNGVQQVPTAQPAIMPPVAKKLAAGAGGNKV